MALRRSIPIALSLCFLLGCPENKSSRQPPDIMNGDDTVYGHAGDSAAEGSLDDEIIRDDPNYVTEGSVDSSNLDILDREGSSGAELDWEPVFFQFDEAILTADARETLTRYAQTLKHHPELKVLLEGHCDSRGTEDYNLALGERRAQAVKRFLVELGVETGNLRTISYGEIRPLVPGETETAWAQNRRVSFTF